MASNKKSRFSPFLKQCFVTAAVSSNIIGHGCVLGYTGILLPQLELEDSILKLSPSAASWIASIMGITQFIGNFVSPPIMEHYGRKVAHFAVVIPNLISLFITILAVNFEMLFVARILQGLSIGMMSPLRSSLIGEYTSPKNRGAFLTMVSLSQAFGIFFVHLIGSLLSWQMTALICVFFPFNSLVMTIYCPESPSWLIMKGRVEDCKKVFHWLRGDEEEDELEEMIHAQMLSQRAKISEKSARRTNKFQDMWITVRKPEFYKPIILMMHSFNLVNFAGGTTMAAYSTLIIGSVMGPTANAHFWMIFLDGQRFVFNALAIFAIKKFKRRTMMFTTGALSVFSQFALAAYLYFKEQGIIASDGFWLPVILINLKIFAVAVGMLPVPNVIGGEVFPLEYRGIGGMISMTSFSATFFIVLKTFTSIVDNFGMFAVYLIYGGTITYCMVIIWLLLPETRGRTLQQIEDEFRGKPLRPEEIEARRSLQEDPVNKRKLSMLSVHSVEL